MTRKRIVASGAVIVVVTAILAAAMIAGASPDDPEVPLFDVKRGRFERQVTAEGTLQASKATPVSAPMNAPGPLKIAWLAPDGSAVSRGEIVVRFDPTDFENNLASGRVGQSTTKNKIGKEGAQFAAVSDNLQLDIVQAELEMEAAEMFQPRDADVFSRFELIESEIDGDFAGEKREYAVNVLDVRGQLSQAERGLLSIEKRQADMVVDRAEQGLSALQVTAPHDGIIVFERSWNGELPRVGGTVWAGRPIGEIPNLETMEAEVFVLEADAGGVETGQAAQVIVESNPGVVYEATVARVDKLARPRVRGVPVQYFSVVLELGETDRSVMKPGARVKAKLIVEDLDDVFSVPVQAVFTKDGRKVVYRWAGTDFEEQVVEAASTSVGRVVVRKGLSDGDRIALRDPKAETRSGNGNGGGSSRPPGLK